MKFSNLVRQHAAALRALLVLTVIVGLAYPAFIWLVAQLPGLHDKANGSIIEVNGKPLGSSLIGQSFTDNDGNALPKYFQSRPSAAGDGYDPLATGASNLGPESIVDTPDKPSLLTLVCQRSETVGAREGVSGVRPFCTGDGVGAINALLQRRLGSLQVELGQALGLFQRQRGELDRIVIASLVDLSELFRCVVHIHPFSRGRFDLNKRPVAEGLGVCF